MLICWFLGSASQITPSCANEQVFELTGVLNRRLPKRLKRDVRDVKLLDAFVVVRLPVLKYLNAIVPANGLRVGKQSATVENVLSKADQYTIGKLSSINV